MNDQTDQDVVDVLTTQHEQISTLIGQIRADHDDKQQLFNELVRLLAVHESAEEEVVHPTAKRAAFGVEDMVKTRLTEENRAKQYLADLYDMGVDHPEFAARFARFAAAVADHAAHEEAEEFTMLRKQFSETQLQRMADTVRFAESVAPTRVHPHAGESPLANVLVGPPLAIFDRVRDAIRNRREDGDG
ncbi:hemerythrin domain-containing protein [Nocardia sp. CA2R105]|uniref:hemerythrin domain-containing protein n=1 Tax=Nocardia coffeae TaxID=2873381 RepID=UPI001CA70D57|nr:hemerythrin domain-containing protein [Nocardia coffeae]MBY8860421.1 hemerythrin domain-containing protein [Nocardia coffeae]